MKMEVGPFQEMRFNGRVLFWQHVTDVERAKQWYADVLGMELEDRISREICVMRITPEVDTKKVALFQSSKQNPKTHAILDFRVENIEEAQTAIKAKGVEVSEICEISEYRRDIQLSDPDGHIILIHEAITAKSPLPVRSS